MAFNWLAQVTVAQFTEPQFEYVNIRLETDTPGDHHKSTVGGADPGSEFPIPDRESLNAATATDTNPFSNGMPAKRHEDLSKFTIDQLESRRDLLLLAIIDQTSAQLEESPSN